MKKTNIAFTLLTGIAMMITSCSSDLSEMVSDNTPVRMDSVYFDISQEGSGAKTRTYINDTSVEWQENDVMAVWDNDKVTRAFGDEESAIQPFYVHTASNTVARIHGVLSHADTNDYLPSIYPYSVGKNCSFSYEGGNSNINFYAENLVFPSRQDVCANSFDKKAAIMAALLRRSEAASIEGNNYFYNLCAYLKLNIQTKFKKVVVTAESSNEYNSHLAGTFKATFKAKGSWADASQTYKNYTLSEAPKLSEGKDYSNTITVGDNGTTHEATTIYIAVLPGTYSSLNVKVYTDDSSYREKSSSLGEINIERSNLYDLGKTDDWTVRN